MGIIKKIVHVLSLIIYVAITAYALTWVPLLFKYYPLVVLSGSMEPTYKVGGIIYYKEVRENELKEGDVITFIQGKKYISHRILSINEGLIETKGDANNAPDALKVSFKDIKGKVASVCIPYAGYYIKFVNEHITFLVILIVIIMVSEFLFSNTKAFDINRKNGRSEDNGQKE